MSAQPAVTPGGVPVVHLDADSWTAYRLTSHDHPHQFVFADPAQRTRLVLRCTTDALVALRRQVNTVLIRAGVES